MLLTVAKLNVLKLINFVALNFCESCEKISLSEYFGIYISAVIYLPKS